MERIPVASSVIASVGYDATAQTLEVEFTSGSVYRYLGVPEQTYRALMAAESKGKCFNRHIRDSFGYEQL